MDVDENNEDGETDLESEYLERLDDLHRQLALSRHDSKSENDRKGPLPIIGENNKIIVCSMRKHIRMVKSKNDDAWQYIPCTGGLNSAIEYLGQYNTIKWVGWPGAVIDSASQDRVRRKLELEHNFTPVFFNLELLDMFYYKFCSVKLWSLFHCLPRRSDIDVLDNFMEEYDAYCQANQKFLETLSEVYEDGDLVLIWGYHLMNLPALVRKRFPDVICGFFLHCPFPSSEFYRMLPVRQHLLQGILGSDLIVFNNFDYVRHFLNAITRVLGLESSPSRVEYNGRLVSLGIYPLGIDPNLFKVTPIVQTQIDILRKQYEGYKILVAIDGIDFCKGVPEKIMAMEHLLQHYKEWRGKVVLFIVSSETARTGTQQYKMLSRRINELVGRVNGRYGSPEYCPIQYVKRAISHEQLVALYNVGDVALITSIMEGINLTAMEYVASQSENTIGALIYSEFAGCASSFKGALIVNPFDIDQIAARIHTALMMSSTTRKIRHHQLSRYVRTYTSTLWAKRSMSALQEAAAVAKEYNVVDSLDTSQLLSYFERSLHRLFILDYDGTLTTYQSLSQLAQPTQAILDCLEQLTSDPSNRVYIVSGRTKDCLQEWFKNLPRLGLAAEHGFWFRPSTSPRENVNEEGMELPHSWVCQDEEISLDWREEVASILEHFTERTPGSLLEKKECCYTWHFRDTDPDFGLNQAKDLQLHLDQMFKRKPAGVIMAPTKQYVMVRPSRLSKGRAVSRIIQLESKRSSPSARDFDFILCIGDERTDEDMYDVVKGSNCFTCTVGRKSSRAQYYLEDPDDVLRILNTLNSLKKTVNSQK